LQAADQDIEPDAMAAYDTKIGEVHPADQLHLASGWRPLPGRYFLVNSKHY